jgi:hypothetical protein
MELVKNFSDETGKGGNPGRFTQHLEQVERIWDGVLAILNFRVLLKGSFTWGTSERHSFQDRWQRSQPPLGPMQAPRPVPLHTGMPRILYLCQPLPQSRFENLQAREIIC